MSRTKPKARYYKGYEIRPANIADKVRLGLKWYVQEYHHDTGLPWSEDRCAHYYTIKAAKEALTWFTESFERRQGR